MKDLIEVLEKVAELLYQEKYQQAYGILIKCLPFLSEILTEMQDMELQQELLQSLTEAVGAMESNDYTLLADILQYDIIDKMKEMGEE